MKELHRDLLICAGWLSYVENNVCTIEYVERLTSEKDGGEVSGRAMCQTNKILVATQRLGALGTFEPIGALESTLTIVHEAAHLEDECENGEDPAIAAEQNFLRDFNRRECARILQQLSK